MIRFASLVVVLAVAANASAGWRSCNRGYYHSYRSSANWYPSCYSCHPRPHAAKAKAYNWREALTTIQGQKVETNAFIAGLQAVSADIPGAPAQGGGAVVQLGQTGGYSYQQSAALSSYPVGGNTVYAQGASAFLPTPTVNRMALMDSQTALQAQLQTSMHAGAQDTADLMALGHEQATTERRLELALQANERALLAARDAEREIHWRSDTTATPPPPMPTPTPGVAVPLNAAPGGGHSAGSRAMLDGARVLETKCAACHKSGGKMGIQGGFDLADLAIDDLKVAVDRINLSPEDPKAMPRSVSDAGEFGPGQALTWQERHAIEALYLEYAK